MFNNLDEKVAKFTEFLATIVLGSVAILLMIQVILRFFFQSGIFWAEEYARFGLIWAVLLAANSLIRDNELITVDFFDYLWPKRFIEWRDLSYQFIFILILAVLLYTGWMQALKNFPRTTSGMQISWFYPYLAIPVGIGLILFQYIYKVLRFIRKGRQ